MGYEDRMLGLLERICMTEVHQLDLRMRAGRLQPNCLALQGPAHNQPPETQVLRAQMVDQSLLCQTFVGRGRKGHNICIGVSEMRCILGRGPRQSGVKNPSRNDLPTTMPAIAPPAILLARLPLLLYCAEAESGKDSVMRATCRANITMV